MQVTNIAILGTIFIFLVSIGGCKTLPQRDLKEVGVEIPAHWSGAQESDRSLPEHWIETFGDQSLSDLVHGHNCSFPQIISKFKFARPVLDHLDLAFLKLCLV